jgi:hypothetical protein
MLPVLQFCIICTRFLGTEDTIYANLQQMCAIYHTVEYINLYSICLISFKQIYLIF